MLLLNNEPQETIIKKKAEEVRPELILQEQNVENNKLLQQVLNQNAILTCLIVRICEELKIDLAKFMEQLNKPKSPAQQPQQPTLKEL